MRYIKFLLLTTVLVTTTLNAESKARKVWKASLVVLAASASADISSSYGQRELNPIVRGANNQFALGKGIALKGGVCVALYFVGRKSTRAGTVANFTAAAVWTSAAAYNWRAQR